MFEYNFLSLVLDYLFLYCNIYNIDCYYYHMATYVNAFKYINLFFIYLIAFSLMWSTRTELIGLVMSMVNSIITNLFLFMDISASPKKTDPIIAILYISIIGLFIVCSLIFTTISKLQINYSVKGQPLRLNREPRKQVDTFKILFTFQIIATGVLAFLFFTLKCNSPSLCDNDNGYARFFSADPESSVSYLILVFKSLLSMAVIGVTGYLIYLSNDIRKYNASNIHIPKKPTEKVILPNSANKDTIFDIFRNVNLDYLMSYKTDLHL